jgi:tetratricopeptide (TPR) repeat protein/predicted aspartyl protease
MSSRRIAWVSLLLTAGLSMSMAGAANRCKLTTTPPLPVKMENLRPVISASINGAEARFMVDTGSFFDFISPAAAAQFKLPLSEAPPYAYVNGVGGGFIPQIATAKTFTVAGVTAHDAQFLVGNNDLQGGIAGLLGQNLFRVMDMEYDFANGVLRFAKPEHCPDENLAYWATAQPIGVVDLHWTSEKQPHLIGAAAVNGHDIEVLFDSGSGRTILSLRAAKRAGITPQSPGVVLAGVTTGMGKNEVKVWSAPIEKFEIGGETIEHTRVLIGDLGLPRALGADMLLGADFFLAHHIYVAYSQSKLYFTYNGGPVFALNARQAPPAPAAPQSGVAARTAGASSPLAAPSDTATDPSALLRRGMADASRGELTQAIADLSRACERAPTDAGCRYQRGLAYWRSAQPRLALADFNAAIELQPNDFEAYLARAQLELPRKPAAAASDLDASDRFAPQQWDQRLELARLYAAAGEYAGAVHQYDLWVEYHPEDVRLAYALSGRCGSEAAANVDVDRAPGDCATAQRLMPPNAPVQARAALRSNRGLLFLREGRLDEALTDFDAALALQPGFPLARYARGLVELKMGLRPQGEKDLAVARARAPALAQHLRRSGLRP